MIYRARTENSDVFIAMYETEEPKKEILIETNPFSHILEKAEHNAWNERIIKQWQSSKREYKVRDQDKSELKELLSKSVNKRLEIEIEHYSFWRQLEKGIDCTFLKDRLKLVTVWEHNTDRSAPTKEDLVEYWTLLPLEDKKENEAVEFAEWLGQNFYRDCIEIKTTWKDIYYIIHQAECKEYTTAELYQIFKNPNKQ